MSTHPDLRDLLIRADSVTSLVGHRYARSVPFDVVEELRAVSGECRKLSEALAEDRDALAVQVAQVRWPQRYVGDLSASEWDAIYDFIGRDRGA